MHVDQQGGEIITSLSWPQNFPARRHSLILPSLARLSLQFGPSPPLLVFRSQRPSGLRSSRLVRASGSRASTYAAHPGLGAPLPRVAVLALGHATHSAFADSHPSLAFATSLVPSLFRVFATDQKSLAHEQQERHRHQNPPCKPCYLVTPSSQ